MGKKSVDETLDSNDEAYLVRDTQTQPSRLLKALVKALAGPERETESERERRERSMELRRRWDEQLAREREVEQVSSSVYT